MILRQAARPQLPVKLRAIGGKLFGQQCWCWGQDIRRPSGNLLLDYGFQRQRAPEGVRGASAYTLYLDDYRTVVLWGWGLYFSVGAGGTLFLNRNSFMPYLMAAAAPPTDVWAMEQLPAMNAPVDASEWLRARMLLAAAARWISEYERWVIDTLGLPYRCQCVTAWRTNTIAAETMAGMWQELAARCL